MSTAYKYLALIALLAGLSFTIAPATAADEAPEAVLLIPDRMAMVEFGFNLANLRDVLLISYRSYEPRSPMLLHVWNGMKWDPLSHDQYRSGSFMPGEPKTVIAIGDKTTKLPDILAQAPKWCQDYKYIDTLIIGDLVNVTGNALGFNNHEWKKMARIYDLSIVDLNADRRKYGKYGPPGSETKAPANKEDAKVDTLTPVPVTTTIDEQKLLSKTTARAKKPAAKVAVPKVAPTKPEPAKPAEAVKVEPPKAETAKPAAAKAVPASKPEAPKAETKKAAPVVYEIDDMPLGSETFEQLAK